jgi:hypothetical protein
MKKLHPDVYKLKIMLAFNNGVPDCWFSGNNDDLWAEMKWMNKLPKRETTQIKPDLSPLQRKWLDDRCTEGRNVCVILGSPEGCYIFTNYEWNETITRNDVGSTRKQVIQWIENQVM